MLCRLLGWCAQKGRTVQCFCFLQALDLAAAATEASQFKSWWWKMQVGKCYYRWVCGVFPSCMHYVGPSLQHAGADLGSGHRSCPRLGMYREAERQFLSAQKNFEMLDLYLYLGKVYTKLDQPLAAVEVYKKVHTHTHRHAHTQTHTHTYQPQTRPIGSGHIPERLFSADISGSSVRCLGRG